MPDTSIPHYTKTAEVNNGELVRVYWSHPTGEDDFDLELCVKRWQEMYPDVERATFAGTAFLWKHGFSVILDGKHIQKPQPKPWGSRA